eukprot:scaffold3623_cov81-Isochrysis_galbana.AAC.2
MELRMGATCYACPSGAGIDAVRSWAPAMLPNIDCAGPLPPPPPPHPPYCQIWTALDWPPPRCQIQSAQDSLAPTLPNIDCAGLPPPSTLPNLTALDTPPPRYQI